MRDPRIDDGGRDFVVPQGVFENLLSAIELTAQDSVRTVGRVERTSSVFYGCAKRARRVLVLEVFDPFSFGPGEEEANHDVVETPIDEVVDNGP
ncbi:MAG: hypothetical protein WBG86_23515 [Polyangiales bacterium]